MNGNLKIIQNFKELFLLSHLEKIKNIVPIIKKIFFLVKKINAGLMKDGKKL